MQPPQGLVDKVRGLQEAEVDRRLAAEDGPPRRLPGGRPDGRRRRPRPAADPALLAGRPGAVHHAPRGDHEGPADRRPQRRHVPDAEDRPALDVHALADPQGRPRGLPRHRRAHRRSRSRSGSTRSPPTRRARRCRSTSTSSCSRASSSGEPVELVQAKTVDLEVPANAEIVLEGYDREGRGRPRGAVRRPHRLLHARRSRSRSSASPR